MESDKAANNGNIVYECNSENNDFTRNTEIEKPFGNCEMTGSEFRWSATPWKVLYRDFHDLEFNQGSSRD